MLDPSCADITARVIEVLGHMGYRADHPAIARAPGLPLADAGARRLLVRPLGRQLHLRHLAGACRASRRSTSRWTIRAWSRPPTGSNRSSRSTAAGARRCQSYDDPSWMGRGEPTASQTAWAVLGLIAAGRGESEAVRRGSSSC